jgi:hypothetical protein
MLSVEESALYPTQSARAIAILLYSRPQESLSVSNREIGIAVASCVIFGETIAPSRVARDSAVSEGSHLRSVRLNPAKSTEIAFIKEECI